jgi:hypothetical protein
VITAMPGGGGVRLSPDEVERIAAAIERARKSGEI